MKAAPKVRIAVRRKHRGGEQLPELLRSHTGGRINLIWSSQELLQVSCIRSWNPDLGTPPSCSDAGHPSFGVRESVTSSTVGSFSCLSPTPPRGSSQY